MVTPTVDDLKVTIRMNLINNNEASTDNVNLATKFHSPDIGEIKGKTTRIRPAPVVRNIVEIPEELLEVQQHLTAPMDRLTVNSLHFLSKVSHEIY